MLDKTHGAELGRVVWAIVILVAVPLFVLVDTALAQRQEWIAESALALDVALRLAWAWIAAVAVLALVPPIRRWLARRAPQLSLLMVSTTLGWIVADVGVRTLAPSSPFHLRAPLSTFVVEPDPLFIRDVSPVARSAHNRLGIRGPELPGESDVYRVLCLGGSTTECLFLDDEQTWTSVLGHLLNETSGRRHWVGSAGRCDYASGHHLRFVESSPVMEKIDAVVVLVGVSDLMRYLLRYDMGDARAPVWYQAAPMHLARDLWSGQWGHGLVVDRTGKNYSIHRSRLVFPNWPRPPDYAPAIEAYKHRLRALIAAARARHVRLVFVNQPVLWDDFLSSQGLLRLAIARVHPYPPDWKYLTAANLRDAMYLYNAALAEVCQEAGVELVDAAGAMSGELRFFYDDYHLTIEGCSQLAGLVAQQLKTEPALNRKHTE